jgi:hypothetical protein
MGTFGYGTPSISSNSNAEKEMNVVHVLKSERDKLRRKFNKLDTRNQGAQLEPEQPQAAYIKCSASP